MNGAQIVALNTGRYYKTSTGLNVGAGCFVKGLEYSTSTSALVIGKPSPEFFKTVLEYHKPEEAIMIGDVCFFITYLNKSLIKVFQDVIDDIQGAQAIGIRGYLVQTGKYLPGDENKLATPPSGVHADLNEVVDAILKDLKKRQFCYELSYLLFKRLTKTLF